MSSTDTALTVVKFREPRPPHGELITVLPTALKYAFKVRKTGTATFQVPRSDPNLTSFSQVMLPADPAMVTIERPDGYVPWVGFVSQFDAKLVDPDVTFTCSDHSWRMASPTGARTQKSVVYSAASGRIIRDLLRDMEDRGEPPIFLHYDDVPDGPAANYQVRADYGLDVLEALAKQCQYEWGFAYDLSAHKVRTRLLWQARLGVDRRDEEVWSEQKHFLVAGYGIQYGNGIKASLVVGGASLGAPFASRPAVMVNSSGVATDIVASGGLAVAKSRTSPYGLGGTRITTSSRYTDPKVMQTQGVQAYDAPENAVEQVTLQLWADAVDMSRFAIGDIRTVRLQTTVLGQYTERVVRIIGAQFDADLHTIDVETQVIT